MFWYPSHPFSTKEPDQCILEANKVTSSSCLKFSNTFLCSSVVTAQYDLWRLSWPGLIALSCILKHYHVSPFCSCLTDFCSLLCICTIICLLPCFCLCFSFRLSHYFLPSLPSYLLYYLQISIQVSRSWEKAYWTSLKWSNPYMV